MARRRRAVVRARRSGQRCGRRLARLRVLRIARSISARVVDPIATRTLRERDETRARRAGRRGRRFDGTSERDETRSRVRSTRASLRARPRRPGCRALRVMAATAAPRMPADCAALRRECRARDRRRAAAARSSRQSRRAVSPPRPRPGAAAPRPRGRRRRCASHHDDALGQPTFEATIDVRRRQTTDLAQQPPRRTAVDTREQKAFSGRQRQARRVEPGRERGHATRSGLAACRHSHARPRRPAPAVATRSASAIRPTRLRGARFRKPRRGPERDGAGPASMTAGAQAPVLPRIRRSGMAFWACSRFSAWSKTMLRGPSSTSSVISSPRCAGRQCKMNASGASRISRAFT